MKKIIIIALLALISNTTFAQDKIKFGVVGGATYSNFRGNSQIEKFNRDIDFLVGISAERSIMEHLSIKANLSYERKSARDKQMVEFRENYDDPAVIYNALFKLHYQYITLPVVAKLEFAKNPHYFVEGGIFIGYLLKSVATNDLPVSGAGDDDFTDSNKRFDTGVVLGIGKTFPLDAKNDLVIELRDNIGLTNTSDIDVINNGTIKTNSINLIVGWSFGR